MLKIFIENTANVASKTTKLLKKAAQKAQEKLQKHSSNPSARIHKSQREHFHLNVLDPDTKMGVSNPGIVKTTNGLSETVKKLSFIEGRTSQLEKYEIENLLNTDKMILKNIFDRNLLNSIEGRTEDLSVKDCVQYAVMTPSKWKRISQSELLKDYDKNGNSFDASQIEILYSASPEYKKSFWSF